MKETVSPRAWWMICLSQAMAGFFYIDRQNLVVLKTELAGILGLDQAHYGTMVAGLMVAYAIGYLVSGWVIDTFGVRRTFPLFVGAMSIATIPSGLVMNASQMGLCRILLGAAEAGVMPAGVVAFIKWIPTDRRGLVQGATRPIMVAAQIASTALPAVLMVRFGWRAAFLLPGVCGLALAFCWWRLDLADEVAAAKDRPGFIRKYLAALQVREVRLLILARAVTDPIWFFHVHWQAVYLQEKIGLSLQSLAAVGWIPTLVRAVAGIGLGLYVDRRIRAGTDPAAARLRVLIGISLLAPLIWFLPGFTGPAAALTLLSLLEIVGGSWLALSTVLMADLAKSGTVATSVAVMNGAGVVVSSVATYFVGGIIERRGYGCLFVACGLAYPLGAWVLSRALPTLEGRRILPSATIAV